jgi:hypothetical protein
MRKGQGMTQRDGETDSDGTIPTADAGAQMPESDDPKARASDMPRRD